MYKITTENDLHEGDSIIVVTSGTNRFSKVIVKKVEPRNDGSMFSHKKIILKSSFSNKQWEVIEYMGQFQLRRIDDTSKFIFTVTLYNLTKTLDELNTA